MATVILNEVEHPHVPSNSPTPLAPGLDPNWTLADLQSHLSGIPLDRIRFYPSLGQVTEQDFLNLLDRKARLVELIDGVLVEKTLGHYESELAVFLGYLLLEFVRPRKLGSVYGTDCPIRLFPEQIREPDVSFLSRSRFPDGKRPAGQILDIAPDLAVEVISPSNTKAEMERKLKDYFDAGVRLVWYVYPITKSVLVFHSPSDVQELVGDMILSGGDVLPGFEISIKTLFDIGAESV